jgi:hypothetical protein
MNVAEMHLAIEQGVDKINSLQADLLLPQEIDIELNKAQMRLINLKYGKGNKYGAGFEEGQKRIDDLRSLVKDYSAPVIFKEQYNNNTWIDSFKLPTDYLYLINQRSEVFINNCNPIVFQYDSINPTSYFIMPQSNLHDGTYMLTSLTMVADPSNPALGSIDLHVNTSYVFPQDLQTYTTFLSTLANWASGIEIHWEQYGNLDHPGSFIIIVDPNVYPWFHFDSSTTNTSSGSNLITSLVSVMPSSNNNVDDAGNSVVYGQFSENTLGTRRIPTSFSGKEFSVNKFIQQDDIFTLLKDPFNTTKYTAPLTTIRGEYIDLYTSDIFIIDKVKITYIRNPAQISLSLGVSCELPIHTHQEVVDMTISSILEGISDPRYQTHQAEVGKNE